MIDNLEYTYRRGCARASLLRKNYNFINTVLTRNIGNVHYAYAVVEELLGSDIGMGRIVHTGLVRDPVVFSVTEKRKEVDNYLTYAKYINQNTVKSLYIKKNGSILFDNLLSLNNDTVNTYSNDNILRFDPYDPLSRESEMYVSLVAAKMHESMYGNYWEGTEKVPHQLTSGYTYWDLVPHNVSVRNLSIVNDGLFSKTSVKIPEILDNTDRLSNVYLQIAKPSDESIRQKFPSNIFWNRKDNIVSQQIINNFNKKIQGRYGAKLQADFKVRTLAGGSVIGFLFDKSKQFTDSISERKRYTYAESELSHDEGGVITNNETTSSHEDSIPFDGIYTESFQKKPDGKDDLISFTNNMFRIGRYKTMIARFGNNASGSYGKFNESDDYSEYNTAISERGMSHGRNLLKEVDKRNFIHRQADISEAYNDPYCRVWTNYHQYNSVHDMIRPFTTVDENDMAAPVSDEMLMRDYGFEKVRTKAVGGFMDGQARLGQMGVLQKNGFVNITPKQEGDAAAKTKRCMFSLENLAWKGCTQSLSKSQIGPFGGRIMWFPPYDLKFSENVSSPWNANQFIGRGEKVYTYTDTERTGQLSFKILVDHPSIINFFRGTNDSDLHQTGLEYDLLRFFAGCGHPVPANISKQENDNNEAEEPKQQPEQKREDSCDKIMCLMFFPNNYTGNYDKDDVDPIIYLLNGIGSQKYLDGKVVKDLPTNPNVLGYSASGESNELIGYEIRDNIGNDPKAYVGGITPADIVTDQEKRENKVTACTYNGYTLVPQKNSESSPLNDWWYRVDVRKSNISCANIKSRNKKVDCEKLFKDEKKLKNVEGHKDCRSFGLNSSKGRGFIYNEEDYKNSYACTVFNLSQEDCENSLFSFTEFYVAFTEKYGTKTKLAEELERNYCDAEKLDILRGILDKRKLTKLETNGWASRQGYEASNIQLGLDRATTAKNFFDKLKVKFGKVTDPKSEGIVPTTADKGAQKDESELKAKIGRSALITIYLSNEESTSLQESSNSDDNDDNFKVAEREKPNQNIVNTESNLMESTNPQSYYESVGTNGRYDDEYRFFKEIDINDTFLRHKIREKIQYFDPAYHSISPEGFNARLTFLHQCTRQGPTIGNSNVNGANRIANNLAFGRQPVCVLRIGDFYYTKIIIESLQITYDTDGIKWDLNPEGIGVQPMFADISITFKFLGGSDLAGPIGRLQNAVSFNYYANTGVYDNRAEMIQYDSNGNYVKFKEFNPINKKITTN